MRVDRIIKLKELGIYSQLVKDEFISTSVNLWYEIYLYHDKRVKINNGFNSKFDLRCGVNAISITETAEAFEVSEMTVRRSIKYMTKPDNT